MKKRISILIFAAVAACASFAFAISSAAGNKTNKTVVYKYALLGDTYKFTEAGEYKIRYSAYDKNQNYTVVEFTVICK